MARESRPSRSASEMSREHKRTWGVRASSRAVSEWLVVHSKQYGDNGDNAERCRASENTVYNVRHGR
jgi:hypothetical protein